MRPRSAGRVIQAVELAEELEVLTHREDGIDARLLRGDPEEFGRSGTVPDGVDTTDGDGARVGAEQAGDDRQQRRLAGSIAPEQADDLARLHVEVDALKRFDLPVTFRDVSNLQHATLLSAAGWRLDMTASLAHATAADQPFARRRWVA